MKGFNEAVIFTSSGIRGVFNETLTLEDIVKISSSFAEVVGEGKIVVGRDTRPSGKPIAEAVIAGLTSIGKEVIDVEVAPTPTILHAIRDLKAAGGIIISASHNPPEWNALKLAGPEGLLLDEEYYTSIKKRISKRTVGRDRPRLIGTVRTWNPFPSYFRSILDYIDREAVRSNPVKVAVDCGGGAGALATPILLRKLGCEVKTIHCHTCGFFPRPLEPNQKTLGDLSQFVISTGSDVGVAHDCDADRMVCVSEDGAVLRPDEGFALIVDGVLREKKGGLVVTNVATSLLVEDVAEKYGAKVVRVAVGEANVVKEMVRLKATVGGEGSSGGVILPAVHYVRDGPLACAKLVEILAKTKAGVSDLLREYPSYYLERVKLSYPKALRHKIMDELSSRYSDENVDLTDGIKLCGDREWVLIRPSRTEPAMRVWAEARSRQRAKQLCENMVREVKSIISELNS